MENERKDNNYFFDSGNLSPAALERKHRIETDPSVRTDIMEYLPGMEVIHSDIRDKVLDAFESYDASKYTARDVQFALQHDTCSIEDFKALLSPAAAPFLEKMAAKAKTKFADLPKTLPVRRDLALLVDREVTYDAIRRVVLACDRKLIRDVNLFDVYESNKLAAGKKSYAISMTLQDDQKTLQDRQIDAVMQKVIKALETQLGAQLR